MTEIISSRKKEPKSVICYRCKRKFDDRDGGLELQEFHHISFVGGYGSVFGDGVEVKCKLCQHCLKEVIGDWCRIEEE